MTKKDQTPPGGGSEGGLAKDHCFSGFFFTTFPQWMQIGSIHLTFNTTITNSMRNEFKLISQMKLVYENLEDTKIIIPFFPICSIFSCLSIATPHEQGVGRCVTDEA